MTFTLKRDDFTPFYQRAEQLRASPRPVVFALCNKFRDITRRNFNSDKSFRTTAWAPLKSGKPSNLFKSGALFRSIFATVGDKSGIVGTPTPYAAQHQTGGTFSVPARSATVRLKTTASGDLVRQDGHPNLAVFAKSTTSQRHKRFTERQVTIPAHSFTLPARPYFPVLADNETLTEKAQAAMIQVGAVAVHKALEKAA